MRHICYFEMPQREFNNFQVVNTCSLGPDHRDAIETGWKKSRKIPQCRNEINQTPSAEVKNRTVCSAFHQWYLRVHVVYPCRVCFQSHGGVPSRVASCRRSRVLRFVVSIYTSHLQGHTPVFSWVSIPGYSLCFFPLCCICRRFIQENSSSSCTVFISTIALKIPTSILLLHSSWL